MKPKPASGVGAMGILLLLAALGGGAWWWLRPERPRTPPTVDLIDADTEVADAITALRGKVLAEPRSAPAWGRLGMVLRAHGFGVESNACFAEAERLDPREPRWPYYRGLTLVLTQPRDGLDCLRRAVERMSSQEIMPRFRLAEVLLEQGEPAEAERLLRQLATTAPGHPRGRLLAARMALDGTEPRKALPELEACLADPQTQRQANLLAAEVWQRLGDAEKSSKYAAEASMLPADAPWLDPLVMDVERLAVGTRTRLAEAVALHQQGNTREAVRLLRELAEAKPREVGPWVMLGQMYRQIRQPASAAEAFARAVAIDPRNVDGWFGLGMARRESKPTEAAAAFREVVRIKPDHTLGYHFLGVCLAEQGDREGAKSAYEAALRCQPDHEPTRKALGELGKPSPK